jgi:Rad3-related DNA helicase
MVTTIAKWLKFRGKSSAIMTPTRILQDQYAAEFDFPVVKGADNYECEKGGSCGDQKKRCKRCPFSELKREAAESSVAIYNYWTYFSNRIWETKSHLLIDEAHNLAGSIQELSTASLRENEVPFPAKLDTLGDVTKHLENYLQVMEQKMRTYKEYPKDLARKLRQADQCYLDLRNNYKDFFIKLSSELDYRYRPPKPYEALNIKPIRVRNIANKFWPKNHIKKVFLFSATIGEEDVRELGLNNYRYGVYQCSSPIPAEHRGVIVDPLIDSSYANRTNAIPQMAAYISRLLEEHPNEKGLIHCTYAVAKELKKILKDSRLMWHNKTNKTHQYERFRAAKQPKVLVASGMEEGIDLVGDLGRWQVILAIPYPSLADPFIKARQFAEPGWYERTAVKTIQQQAGRICRTPDDVGITYIVDRRFPRFYNNTRSLWPYWFTEAIQWKR